MEASLLRLGSPVGLTLTGRDHPSEFRSSIGHRHLSLRTQRIGLLPRPSGGPQTSRAAIELNSLGASVEIFSSGPFMFRGQVAEFPRMSVRNEPPPTSSRLPAGSKFKFGLGGSRRWSCFCFSHQI